MADEKAAVEFVTAYDFARRVNAPVSAVMKAIAWGRLSWVETALGRRLDYKVALHYWASVRGAGR